MARSILPPPPSSQGVSSDTEGLVRSWADWFFRVARLLEENLPDTTAAVISGEIFTKPAMVMPQEIVSSNLNNVLALGSFQAPPVVQRIEPADTQSILANQIFGD